MKRVVACLAVAVAVAVAACSSTETTAPTTSDMPGSTLPATTAGTTSTSAPTPATTATSIAPATTTAPTISWPTSTTTTTTEPQRCDVDEAIAIADATIVLARLEPGGAWQTDTESAVFDERTNDAIEFGDRVAFTCAEQLVQSTPTGAERLALVAWNDVRHAAVVQATDAPVDPYRADARFQLFLEQPFGEWLDDQFVWAATMSGGESIVIATHDYSAALTAKSWQSEVERFPDIPVTLESEQFAIDALLAAGARNVSVAEPAFVGYPIGSIQFNTPLALGGFAVIGPADSFDPMVPIVPDGESTFSIIDGVEIRLTVGKELGQFDLYETGWSCGDHAWRLYAGLGSPREVADFTETLVQSLDC